jgi:outer membrane lipoprotein-sorting protein
MTFSMNVARALMPMAVIVSAAPAAAAESADMAHLKAHISSVQTMTARFTQIDAKGRTSTGSMQLKRPGKVRFQYGSGDLLLVADGRNLYVLDYQAQIVPGSDSRIVTVRARDPAQYGSLTLVFMRNASAPGGLQLYGWTALDGQNRRTTVKLSDVRYNVAVPESAFTFREPKKS